MGYLYHCFCLHNGDLFIYFSCFFFVFYDSVIKPSYKAALRLLRTKHDAGSFLAASPLLILFATEDCLELTLYGKIGALIAVLLFAITLTFIVDRFLYGFSRLRDKYYNLRKANARARLRRIKLTRKLSAMYSRYFANSKLKGVILYPLIFALFIRGFFKNPASKKYAYFILFQSLLAGLLIRLQFITLQEWVIGLLIIGSQLIRIDQLGFLANNLATEGVALTTPLLVAHLRHNITSMKTSRNIIVRYVGTRAATGIFFGKTGLTPTGKAAIIGAIVGTGGVLTNGYYQRRHEAFQGEANRAHDAAQQAANRALERERLNFEIKKFEASQWRWPWDSRK